MRNVQTMVTTAVVTIVAEIPAGSHMEVPGVGMAFSVEFSREIKNRRCVWESLRIPVSCKEIVSLCSKLNGVDCIGLLGILSTACLTTMAICAHVLLKALRTPSFRTQVAIGSDSEYQ